MQITATTEVLVEWGWRMELLSFRDRAEVALPLVVVVGVVVTVVVVHPVVTVVEEEEEGPMLIMRTIDL